MHCFIIIITGLGTEQETNKQRIQDVSITQSPQVGLTDFHAQQNIGSAYSSPHPRQAPIGTTLATVAPSIGLNNPIYTDVSTFIQLLQ